MTNERRSVKTNLHSRLRIIIVVKSNSVHYKSEYTVIGGKIAITMIKLSLINLFNRTTVGRNDL